jgi:hypothetical protein
MFKRRYVWNTGLTTTFQKDEMVVVLLPGGPLRTRRTAPKRHCAQPILAVKFSFSFKNMSDMMAEITTEPAPRGVTSMAGEKAYAAILHISPINTE